MTREDLMRNYWRYYLIYEDRFMATTNYVELCEKNKGTYSVEYAILLQSIGAELDNFFKEYCNITKERPNIDDYCKSLFVRYPDIVNQKIKIKDTNITIQPFENWDSSHPSESLSWWKAFTNIKHHRVEHIDEASLINVLNILGALFLLEMKKLSEIAKEEKDNGNSIPDIPDRQSALYELDWQFHCVPFGNGVFAFGDF